MTERVNIDFPIYYFPQRYSSREMSYDDWIEWQCPVYIDIEECAARATIREKREREERKLINRITKLFWSTLFKIFMMFIK